MPQRVAIAGFGAIGKVVAQHIDRGIEGLTLALAQELPPMMAAIPLNPGVIDTAMLRQCWKDRAATFQKADAWAKRAAPLLLNLSARENGKSMTVPT